MLRFLYILFGFAFGIGSLCADNLPKVPNGFEVSVFAQEPLIRNPCAMAFDGKGRLYVSQGVQYRHPKPDTPGDRISILIDDDGDGHADRSHTFADGLNHVQDLAWRGDELWVAAAPELLVLRDLDGDDVADSYKLLYGGLGNLEHALHGFNFGPDGRIYMSKGNSKGYLKADSSERHVAPKAFADLWGDKLPEGAPDLPKPIAYTRETFQRGYHTPSDDWGREGGILSCLPDGSDLRIHSRGCRNPWDMTFDDNFDWLATDQDQDGGDRIIRPFRGAHFGWGHAWSPHWTGKNHLPTVPVSGPNFDGSGTGIIYCASQAFPKRYQGVYFVNDWLKRTTFVYRPKWEGGHMNNPATPEIFAAAPTGRAMGSSKGVLYDVTDLEMGPDGALWVMSWGHGYGARFANDKQIDEGRVYRIYPKGLKTAPVAGKYQKPYPQWTDSELIDDLQHDRLPCWRIDAADELVRRGPKVAGALQAALEREALPPGAATWIVWTLGRMAVDSGTFERRATEGSVVDRVQALRVLGHRARSGKQALPLAVREQLLDPEPRIRFAAARALVEGKSESAEAAILASLDKEDDRLAFYAKWRALQELQSEAELLAQLKHGSAAVRLASLLALTETGTLDGDVAAALRLDSDSRVAELAAAYVQKIGTNAKPVLALEPDAAVYGDKVLRVTMVNNATENGLRIRYTTDGKTPTDTTGETYKGPYAIRGTTTIRAALFRGRVRVGPIVQRDYRHQPGAARVGGNPASPALPTTVRNLQVESKSQCAILDGMVEGDRVYVNRSYEWTQVPSEYRGLTAIQTSNDDPDVGSTGDRFFTFELPNAATVFVAHDNRVGTKPKWLEAFEKSEKTMRSGDASYAVYSKAFPAGVVQLGGNTTDGNAGGRSNYAVFFRPGRLVLVPPTKPTTVAAILATPDKGDPHRGRQLFFGPAFCANCHSVQDGGKNIAPALNDLGSRADRAAMAEAILEPGAVITEGFQAVDFTMKDGARHMGFIKSESGVATEIVTADGSVKSLRNKEVLKRARLEDSVMPPIYGNLLTPGDVTDLIAYLKTQTVDRRVGVAAQTPKAKGTSAYAVRTVAPVPHGDPVLIESGSFGSDKGFSAKLANGEMQISLDGKVIASYYLRHDKVKRPFWAHVKTKTGRQVTRNYPPVPGKDPTDHGDMHPGVWLGFSRLAPGNFWHNTNGEVVHQGFIEPPTIQAGELRFAVLNAYVSGRTICRELCRYRLRRVPSGWAMTQRSSFDSDDAFEFGVREEMGFGVRLASPLRVQGGNGRITSSHGGVNEKDTWGKVGSWWDYSGSIDGKPLGVTILSGSGNPDTWSHSRDYGLLVANPFPVDVAKNREIKTKIPAGRAFELTFGIIIHEGDGFNPAQIADSIQADW